mmetsp:Transcript_673/g.783  ORF Transcript_673/g.783 Transcript_673/m.783 type:complete len:111 (+) Transcript_673:423-755(+)
MPFLLALSVLVIFIVRKKIAAEITARRQNGQLMNQPPNTNQFPQHQPYPAQNFPAQNYPQQQNYPAQPGAGQGNLLPQNAVPMGQPGRMDVNAYPNQVNPSDNQPLLGNQ